LFTTQLAKSGQFDLSQDPAFKEAATKYGFLSGKSTHSDRLNTIRNTYKDHALMIDTHTADGLKVARDVIKAGKVKAGAAMIVLETALPIKFAETIVEALGCEPDRPAKFEGIEALPKRVVNMPADVAQLKAFIVEKCA
jgi:threonine synthase